MPRDRRQGEKNFVLDQFHDIQVLLIGQEVPRIILQLLLRQIMLVIDEFEQSTNSSRLCRSTG